MGKGDEWDHSRCEVQSTGRGVKVFLTDQDEACLDCVGWWWTLDQSCRREVCVVVAKFRPFVSDSI